jgi:hypothetical protein
VTNAIDVKATRVRCTCFLDHRADSRLRTKDVERGLEILSHRAWHGESVHRPPLRDAFNLARCALRDVELEDHAQPNLRRRANSSSSVIMSP